MAWLFCSKEDVASIHPTPISELRDEWSDMVEGLIRQHLGQPNMGTLQPVTGEWHDGDGTHLLYVRKPPIHSVMAIRVNGLYLLENDYVVFPTHIELKSQVFPRGRLNVSLDYMSGSEGVDDVVRLCAAAMIVAILNYRKTRGADASLKWGDPVEKKGDETPNYNVGLTSHLVTIMRRLLKRSTVRVR